MIIKSPFNLSLNIFYLAYALVFFIVAFHIEPMHDYSAYLTHWDLVLNGGDPWQKMHAANAYGPVYNLFAWLYSIHYQLPKLIFVGSWLFIAIYSVDRFLAISHVTVQEKTIYFVFWFFNPFFIISTLFYGFNDNFVALLVFVSMILVLFYQQTKLAVFIITLAVLTKIYPVFLLPYMDKLKQNIFKNFKLFVMTLFTGYLFTYLVWGSSFTNAFGKANGRDPTLFSIMKFLNGSYFPFEAFGQLMLLISSLMVLSGVLYVFYLFKHNRIKQHTAFLAGFTMVLTFYKAGQFQFFIAYFAIFAVWALVEFKDANPNKSAFYSVLILGSWLSIMVGIIYPLSGGFNGEYEYIQEIIGLPTFFMEILVLFFLLSPSRVKVLAISGEVNDVG